MQIAFFVSNYSPSVGGAQTHVQRVAEGLANRHGHGVTILTTDALLAPGGRHPGRVRGAPRVIGGVEITRLGYGRGLHSGLRTTRRVGRRLGVYHQKPGSALEAGPIGVRLAAMSRRLAHASDAVVGVSAPFMTLVGADLCTRGTRTAHIAMPLLHLSEFEPRQWVVRSLRRADGCTSSTTFEYDWLKSHGVVSDRLGILPPGCDPEMYPDVDSCESRRMLGLPQRQTVGFLGRFAAHKGLGSLAVAMERVWEEMPETSLLLAGGRTGWEGFEGVLSRLQAAGGDRVILRENFADRDRAALLAACDVIAFPSEDESFGMVTVEGWCARRPVVAADIPAVRSLIRPGADGDLVPVAEPVSLARALIALMRDPGRRIRYAQAGRRRAEVDFAWDRVVDGWDAFLADAVRRRRAR